MNYAPLRSRTNHSQIGFNPPSSQTNDRFRSQVEHLSNRSGRIIDSPSGDILLVRGRFDAFSGAIAEEPYLRVGLCLGGSAHVDQRTSYGKLEGMWRKGSVAITPPVRSGQVSSTPISMLGLAIAVDAQVMQPIAGKHALWNRVASHFYTDALLSSVMIALWHEAEAHGTDTGFFEQGLALVADRLQLAGVDAPPARSSQPLATRAFHRVVEFVDAHLGEDISVVALASIAGSDPSGFTRAFKARTGLTPYAWLTERRMRKAATLLEKDIPVTVVASMVGYVNASKFAAAFRRVMAMAPSRWRQREYRKLVQPMIGNDRPISTFNIR